MNGKRVATPWKPALEKLAFAFCCLVFILYVGPYTDPHIIADRYASMGIIQWSFFWFFIIFIQRVQYYYAWVVADGICNLSGFGFNGFDENGKAKWDLVTNVDPYKVEVSSRHRKHISLVNLKKI